MRSGVQWLRLAMLAALAACHGPGCPSSTASTAGAARRLVARHPTTGMVLAMPEAYAGQAVVVKTLAVGFAVGIASNGRTRFDTSATAECVCDTGPVGTASRSRKVRGVEVVYVESPPEDAGSGGAEFTLTAWERCGRGAIRYQQSWITEVDPDFTFLWTVVEGMTPPREGCCPLGPPGG